MTKSRKIIKKLTANKIAESMLKQFLFDLKGGFKIKLVYKFDKILDINRIDDFFIVDIRNKKINAPPDSELYLKVKTHLRATLSAPNAQAAIFRISKEELDQITIRRLAMRLQITYASTHALVNTLEEVGYIQSMPIKNDNRNSRALSINKDFIVVEDSEFFKK